MDYLVYDVGGTEIKYALMNEKAEILEKQVVKTPRGEHDDVNTFVETLGKIYDTYKGKVEGIAVSMPGFIESDIGFCRTGGILYYNEEQPMAELLNNRCQVPVTIENDGKCAALAEKWKGSLQSCKNGAVILLGTGVGGGIIIDGKLLKGKDNTAGECSFLALGPRAWTDKNGFWGYASGNESLRILAEKHTGIPKEEWNGILFFERANQGDENILKALDEFLEPLSLQIYNLHALLDLDVIAIGGGISRQPLLISSLQKKIENFMNQSCLCHSLKSLSSPNVVNCHFYNEANLIGALYHYKMLKQQDLFEIMEVVYEADI